MYPILFAPDATSWDTFGIGVLSDAISCEVEENRNGAYELEMTYPITGAHFDDIALRCLVLAKPNYTDNPQPFRIYAISKPLNGIVTVNAQHISYDLSGYVDAPFTAANAQIALAKFTDSTIVYPYPCPFMFYTNIIGTAVMRVKHPESVRALMGGVEGSVIDNYGGEWHFDWYNCELHSARGADRGIVIQYGKNMTDLKQEENNASVYTGVYPYYYNKDNDILVTLPEKVILGSGTYSYTRILPLDFSFDFEETPTEAQIRSKAQAYINSHQIGVPDVNLTIRFLETDSVSERVDLCDTVTVKFDELGVSASAKCIRTKWDVLRGRYIEAELGSAKNSLAGTIANSSEIARVIDERTSQFQSVAAGIISKVTGNQGGYIVLHDTNNDGEPDEILIMDNADITQAVNIIRMNNGGIAFSKTGYNGTYTTAWNINGEFVADFIASGELQTDHVTILGDTQFYWDSSNITLVDPSDTNKIIRFGKYDGTNYGLAFSTDGGTTWKSGINFNGITLVDQTGNGWAKMNGDSFEIYNSSGVSLCHLGIGTVNKEDGTIGTGPYYRLGTFETGASHGEYSFAGGRFTNPAGPHSVCIGYDNDSTALSTIAIGKKNKSTQEACLTFGIYNEATGTETVTKDGTTYKIGATAIGHYSKATYGTAIALGTFCEANALEAVAIGYSAEATVQYGIAIGDRAQSNGDGTVTIGEMAHSNGSGNVVIGCKAEANQYARAVAIGFGAYTYGAGAIAIGELTEATAHYATSIGNENYAGAQYSVVIGHGLSAKTKNQFICGCFNTEVTHRFVVGNGTDDDNRSNCLRLANSGNMWIAGTLTQGSDARQKDVIGEPPDLSGIHAVRFKWNDKKNQHDDIEHIGYLAQDVEAVAPYLIEENEDDHFKSLNYTEFLCAKIDNLERLVERLTARIVALEGAM